MMIWEFVVSLEIGSKSLSTSKLSAYSAPDST